MGAAIGVHVRCATSWFPAGAFVRQYTGAFDRAVAGGQFADCWSWSKASASFCGRSAEDLASQAAAAIAKPEAGVAEEEAAIAPTSGAATAGAAGSAGGQVNEEAANG